MPKKKHGSRAGRCSPKEGSRKSGGGSRSGRDQQGRGLSSSNASSRGSREGHDAVGVPFIAALRQAGLVVRSIVADGNCLFRAAADQLYGDQGLHVKLREAAVSYIRSHPDDFQAFLDTEKTLSRITPRGSAGKAPGGVSWSCKRSRWRTSWPSAPTCNTTARLGWRGAPTSGAPVNAWGGFPGGAPPADFQAALASLRPRGSSCEPQSCSQAYKGKTTAAAAEPRLRQQLRRHLQQQRRLRSDLSTTSSSSSRRSSTSSSRGSRTGVGVRILRGTCGVDCLERPLSPAHYAASSSFCTQREQKQQQEQSTWQHQEELLPPLPSPLHAALCPPVGRATTDRDRDRDRQARVEMERDRDTDTPRQLSRQTATQQAGRHTEGRLRRSIEVGSGRGVHGQRRVSSKLLRDRAERRRFCGEGLHGEEEEESLGDGWPGAGAAATAGSALFSQGDREGDCSTASLEKQAELTSRLLTV
ncbi:hypothetical protein Esti_003199 [Eimeria stiedai]